MTSQAHYFIGVSIPKEIQERLSNWRKQNQPNLSFKTWVSEGDYHITLVFLGGTPEHQKTVLVKRLMEVAASHRSFDLQISSLQTFGKSESPRVVWLGVNDSSPLNRLQVDIARECKNLDFRLDERPYRPHITIAKQWKGEGAFPYESYRNEMIVPPHDTIFSVESFNLFQIHLHRKPRYEPIHKFQLQGKG
ncbi:RNA 2',3'-cyclic phosphodiesterase [Bacillus songklensis]|uniref:RNA 2',3'-cyclic phosphodiesterase n=1 Tax=Bacillus songklensis TaxID=1069116 RepID=UPI00366E703C